MKKYLLILLVSISLTTFGQGSDLVISQIYGARFVPGTNAFRTSYVELFNRSNHPVNITGYALQIRYIYTFSNTTSWYVKPLPAVTIAPGQYFLTYGPIEWVSEPTPTVTGDHYISDFEFLNFEKGSVALTNNTVQIVDYTMGANVVDRVSWGTADQWEGSGGLPGSNDYSKAIFRKDNGCQDTDDNSWDFEYLPANPRKTTSPLNICGYIINPTIVAGPPVYNLQTSEGTASASKSYFLAGYNLSPAIGNITVTPPAQYFEISVDNVNFFNTAIDIPYTGGQLPVTSVYVRISASASIPGIYINGTIMNSGANATSVTLPVTGYFTKTYYNTKADLGLENLGTWSTTVDGSGPSPLSLTGTHQTFTIVNEAFAHYAGVLDLNALDTRIRVGDGISPIRFVINPGADSITSATKIDVTNNAVLAIKNTRIPILNNLETGSTVDLSQTGTTASDIIRIPKYTYHHLRLTGGLKYFVGGSSSPIIRGDFVADGVISLGGYLSSGYPTINCQGDISFINGTAFDMTNAGNNSFLAIKMNKPSGIQHLNVSVPTIYLINLGRDSTGVVNIIASPGTDIQFMGGFTTGLNFNSSNTTFSTTGGSLSFYNSSTINNNSSANINFSSWLSSTGTSFKFLRTGIGQNMGRMRFTTGSTINELVLRTANYRDSVRIGTDVTITGTLELTKSRLRVEPAANLYLSATTVVTPAGGSSVSYVDGKLTRTGTSAFTFPMGSINAERHAPVDIANLTGAADTYTAFYSSRGKGNYTIDPATLGSFPAYRVSQYEYWEVTPSVPGSGADLRFHYLNSSSILDPLSLRLAHFDGTDWNDIGGVPDPANNATAGSVQLNGVTDFNTFTFSAATSAVIPIQLLSFTVSKRDGYAQLDWASAQELRSKEFIVERSLNGNQWVVIGRVAAAGNSNAIARYQTKDMLPSKGINYYRLKQVDLDDQFKYSDVKTAFFSNETSVILFPNPASEQVTVYLPGNTSLATIRITDMHGKLVKEVYSSDETVQINVSGFTKGVYVLKMFGKGIKEVRKVVVN